VIFATISSHSFYPPVDEQYPPELEVKETTDTASSASFLDLYLEFDDSGQISTKIYDKRDDFNFKIMYADDLLKQCPSKGDKYVIDEELQHTDHLFLGVACFTFLNFVRKIHVCGIVAQHNKF
jgi:hypothetical protein